MDAFQAMAALEDIENTLREIHKMPELQGDRNTSNRNDHAWNIHAMVGGSIGNIRRIRLRFKALLKEVAP